MLITQNCFNYITSALGNSFNLGLLWAFSSIMVLSPWWGSTSKWFLPTFLKLRSFKNDQSLMNFSATYKSFKLFRGINASSWISEMLFFSRSLKRIFIIVNTTFFTVPFKWIAKIWVVFKLSFRKRKYFSFSGKSSAFLCLENSFSYIHLQFCLILWPKSRALAKILIQNWYIFVPWIKSWHVILHFIFRRRKTFKYSQYLEFLQSLKHFCGQIFYLIFIKHQIL